MRWQVFMRADILFGGFECLCYNIVYFTGQDIYESLRNREKSND